MDEQSPYPTLFAFHWHNNERLMDLAAELDESTYYQDPEYGRGSVHRIFFHILGTDRGWRLGVETGRQHDPLSPEEFPDLDALREGFEREKLAWEALLDRLDSDRIEAPMKLTARNGAVRTLRRWQILQHVVLHGMQHHAELAQILTHYGQSPGDLDFIFYR